MINTMISTILFIILFTILFTIPDTILFDNSLKIEYYNTIIKNDIKNND